MTPVIALHLNRLKNKQRILYPVGVALDFSPRIHVQSGRLEKTGSAPHVSFERRKCFQQFLIRIAFKISQPFRRGVPAEHEQKIIQQALGHYRENIALQKFEVTSVYGWGPVLRNVPAGQPVERTGRVKNGRVGSRIQCHIVFQLAFFAYSRRARIEVDRLAFLSE